MNIYKENGYESRTDYLNSLAEEFGIDYEIVKELAMILGHNEDFDGLVSMLQDTYAEAHWNNPEDLK